MESSIKLFLDIGAEEAPDGARVFGPFLSESLITRVGEVIGNLRGTSKAVNRTILLRMLDQPLETPVSSYSFIRGCLYLPLNDFHHLTTQRYEVKNTPSPLIHLPIEGPIINPLHPTGYWFKGFDLESLKSFEETISKMLGVSHRDILYVPLGKYFWLGPSLGWEVEFDEEESSSKKPEAPSGATTKATRVEIGGQEEMGVHGLKAITLEELAERIHAFKLKAVHLSVMTRASISEKEFVGVGGENCRGWPWIERSRGFVLSSAWSPKRLKAKQDAELGLFEYLEEEIIWEDYSSDSLEKALRLESKFNVSAGQYNSKRSANMNAASALQEKMNEKSSNSLTEWRFDSMAVAQESLASFIKDSVDRFVSRASSRLQTNSNSPSALSSTNNKSSTPKIHDLQSVARESLHQFFSEAAHAVRLSNAFKASGLKVSVETFLPGSLFIACVKLLLDGTYYLEKIEKEDWRRTWRTQMFHALCDGFVRAREDHWNVLVRKGNQSDRNRIVCSALTVVQEENQDENKKILTVKEKADLEIAQWFNNEDRSQMQQWVNSFFMKNKDNDTENIVWPPRILSKIARVVNHAKSPSVTSASGVNADLDPSKWTLNVLSTFQNIISTCENCINSTEIGNHKAFNHCISELEGSIELLFALQGRNLDFFLQDLRPLLGGEKFLSSIEEKWHSHESIIMLKLKEFIAPESTSLHDSNLINTFPHDFFETSFKETISETASSQMSNTVCTELLVPIAVSVLKIAWHLAAIHEGQIAEMALLSLLSGFISVLSAFHAANPFVVVYGSHAVRILDIFGMTRYVKRIFSDAKVHLALPIHHRSLSTGLVASKASKDSNRPLYSLSVPSLLPSKIVTVSDLADIEAFECELNHLLAHYPSSSSSNKPIITVDMEWRPSISKDLSPVSLMQLCLPDLTIVLVDMLILLSPWLSANDRAYFSSSVEGLSNESIEDFDGDEQVLHAVSRLLCLLFGGRFFVVGFDPIGDLKSLIRSYGYLLPELLNSVRADAFHDLRSIRTLATGEIDSSLSDLCNRVLKYPLNKKEQCSDWASRPLTSSQLQYAALDALCLYLSLMVTKGSSEALGTLGEEDSMELEVEEGGDDDEEEGSQVKEPKLTVKKVVDSLCERRSFVYAATSTEGGVDNFEVDPGSLRLDQTAESDLNSWVLRGYSMLKQEMKELKKQETQQMVLQLGTSLKSDCLKDNEDVNLDLLIGWGRQHLRLTPLTSLGKVNLASYLPTLSSSCSAPVSLKGEEDVAQHLRQVLSEGHQDSVSKQNEDFNWRRLIVKPSSYRPISETSMVTMECIVPSSHTSLQQTSECSKILIAALACKTIVVTDKIRKGALKNDDENKNDSIQINYESTILSACVTNLNSHLDLKSLISSTGTSYRILNAQELPQKIGFLRGTIGIFGWDAQKIFVSKSVVDSSFEWVTVGGGRVGVDVILSMKELLRLPNVVVVDF